jgi:VanZ family protein
MAINVFAEYGAKYDTTRAKGRIATIAMLVGLAAALEAIQRLIPGRHSQLIDWFASSFGAGLGVLTAS